MSRLTLILGAGASRGVSYANPGEFPSPLDGDFFDLLQRLKPPSDDRAAVDFILEEVSKLPAEFRRSMERSFYTLHLRAYLRRKFSDSDKSEEEKLVGCFAHSTEALLRESHGKRTCEHHTSIIAMLGGNDAVISFNYDLVVERALRPLAESRKAPIGGMLYRFAGSAPYDLPVPKILKLHGSANWVLRGEVFSTFTDWKEFDRQPQYLRHALLGTNFPIFLPFWDKDIARIPWLPLWKEAFLQLQGCDTIIVWGYSLPPTDVKARELFSIAVRDSGTDIKLCVIDPSAQTRQRWRDLYPRARFWEYTKVDEFLTYPPKWWSNSEGARKK